MNREDNFNEYSEGALWFTEEGGALIVGLTQTGLNQCGEVISIELAEAGEEFAEGDWLGEVRGKNSSVEITAPCRMAIRERNEQLISQPDLLEEDPTGDAWLVQGERGD